MHAQTTLPIRVALSDPSERDMQVVRSVLGYDFSLVWLTTVRQTIQICTESDLNMRPHILIVEMNQHDEVTNTRDPYGGLILIRTLVSLYPTDTAFVTWHQQTFGSAYLAPPIVVLAWNHEVDAKSAALENGAVSYIVKPTAPDLYREWMQSFPDQLRRIPFMTHDLFWQSPLLRIADSDLPATSGREPPARSNSDTLRRLNRYRWQPPHA